MTDTKKPTVDAEKRKLATDARKAKHAKVNEAHRIVNARQMTEIGLLRRESITTRTRRDRKGNTYQVEVAKWVRPSKMLRTHRRASERLFAAKAAARVAAAAAASAAAIAAQSAAATN